MIKVNSMDSLDRDDVTPDDDDDIIDESDDFLEEHRDSTGSLTSLPTRNGLRSSIKETFKNVTSKTSSKVTELFLSVLNCSV